MTPDYDKAAILAAETLVKYNIRTAPVSPLPILEQMDNVIVVSFSEMSDLSGMDRSDLIKTLGKSRDAITSIHMENGVRRYVVAYNRLLPHAIIQHALARELAHIVLRHNEPNEVSKAEAECFECHLLYPRPLIRAFYAVGSRVTVDLLANLTGLSDQSLVKMRHIPGAKVPPGLNRFVRSLFKPFFMNVFDYYQYVMPKDGSAIADLGTYMDNYEE